MKPKDINGDFFAWILENDGQAGTEYRKQWDLITHNSQLEVIFRLENDLHAVETRNFHEEYKIAQEVGTGILAFDTIVGWVLELVIYRTGMG